MFFQYLCRFGLLKTIHSQQGQQLAVSFIQTPSPLNDFWGIQILNPAGPLPNLDFRCAEALQILVHQRVIIHTGIFAIWELQCIVGLRVCAVAPVAIEFVQQNAVYKLNRIFRYALCPETIVPLMFSVLPSQNSKSEPRSHGGVKFLLFLLPNFYQAFCQGQIQTLFWVVRLSVNSIPSLNALGHSCQDNIHRPVCRLRLSVLLL